LEIEMPKLNKPRTPAKTRAKKDRKSLPPAQASGDQPIPYRLADTSIRGLRREALGREVHAEAEDAVRRAGGVPPSWESEADGIRETCRRIGERLWDMGRRAARGAR
jgi:hypothetical protein